MTPTDVGQEHAKADLTLDNNIHVGKIDEMVEEYYHWMVHLGAPEEKAAQLRDQFVQFILSNPTEDNPYSGKKQRWHHR